METEYSLLVALVRSQMDGTPFEIPEDVDYQALLQIACEHRLEPFVYAALQDRQLPENISRKLFAAYHRAVFLDTQFDYVSQQITRQLEARGIPHVFMRGICLKHDYPVPAMRTMTDIDVLVHSKDFRSIRKAMEAIGGEYHYGDGNHRCYLFPSNVEVEFHPNLIHCSSAAGTGINPGWQYVPEGQGTFAQEMTEEGFYLNVMCHLANHFFNGGVGIRFVLDIWVCRHLRQTQPDRRFVEQELERVGLLKFAHLIEDLSEVWFSGLPMTEQLQELAEYVMTSGIHGVEDRAMLNAVCFSPGGSGASALWKKVFYPKGDLENRFDWVQGRPWLLPAAWLVRAWKAVTQRGALIFRWGKGTTRYSATEVNSQKTKLERFGVKYKENR